MARKSRQTKEPRPMLFRASIVDENTHRLLWEFKFSRLSLSVSIVTAVAVILTGAFLLIAYTPLRNFVPGYPETSNQRVALQNAYRLDSLTEVVARWEFYSENLRRIVEGEDPIKIDSLIKSSPSEFTAKADAEELRRKDSLMRQTVLEEEEFGLTYQKRVLPMEGMHFFSPLKGVVSQGYEEVIHPYIDITAPSGSVVTSILDGTVVNAGWSDENGYTIEVQHEEGILSIYKHNQKLLKKTGDKVTAGSPIALVGNTGSLTTGDHLHFELWYQGEAVDPTMYIKF